MTTTPERKTQEQIERAALAMIDASPDVTRETVSDEEFAWYLRDARAALAAAGVAPQEPESGRCGGCRDLGPHRNVPSCEYYEPETAQQECPECGGSICRCNVDWTPAPSPDREKLLDAMINEYRDRSPHEFTEEWMPRVLDIALAAQSVLDPEKVANVLDEHEYMYSQYGCDCGWAGPGTHRDHTARALCEAAKRGELT